MIGIFDSGVGGMTVARAVEQTLPGYRVTYFGDLARTPYGSKSAEAISCYARQNTEFLLNQGAKLIIIACNSAASVAADAIRAEFDVPIFEVIQPAIKRAVAASSGGRIGVIGTRATIASGIYERQIKKLRPEAKVFSQACPLLVPLVEEGWRNKQETKMILRRYLQPLKQQQIDTLVLGCTHYPLLRDLIQPRIGRRVSVVDSSLAVADELTAFLLSHPEVTSTLDLGDAHRYFVSDCTEAATKTAQSIFGRRLELIKTTEVG